MRRLFFCFIAHVLILSSVFSQEELSQIPWKKFPIETEMFAFADTLEGQPITRLIMNEPGHFTTLLLDDEFGLIESQEVRKPSLLWNQSFTKVVEQREATHFFFKNTINNNLSRASLSKTEAEVEVADLLAYDPGNEYLPFVTQGSFFVAEFQPEAEVMMLHSFLQGVSYRKDRFPILVPDYFARVGGQKPSTELVSDQGTQAMEQTQSLRKLFVRDDELVLTFDHPDDLVTHWLRIELKDYFGDFQNMPIPDARKMQFTTSNSTVYGNRLYQAAANEESLWLGIRDLKTGELQKSTFYASDAELMAQFDTATYRRYGDDRIITRQKETLMNELRKQVVISVEDLLPGEKLALLRVGAPWTGTTASKVLRTTLKVLSFASTIAHYSGMYYTGYLGNGAYLVYEPDYYFLEQRGVGPRLARIFGKQDPIDFAYVEGVIDETSIRPLLAELPTPLIEEVRSYLESRGHDRRARGEMTFFKDEDFILVYYYKKDLYVVRF
jgi:hypothetical protein